MKTNAWAVWGPLRLGGPGPAGPLDKTALVTHTHTHTQVEF